MSEGMAPSVRGHRYVPGVSSKIQNPFSVDDASSQPLSLDTRRGGTSHGIRPMEAIPVLDLRLLTQADINALSCASSGAGDNRRCDDVVIPKIDHSVFNESAGSRKQTYSRLRLAPRKPPELCHSGSPSPSYSGSARGRRRAGGLIAGPSASSSADAPSNPPPAPSDPLPVPFALDAVDDSGRLENRQIVLFLRQLFARNGIEIPKVTAPPHDAIAIDLRANVNAKLSPVENLRGKGWREQEATNSVNKDSDVLNVNGVAVDLIGLGAKEEIFEADMMRMTQGLVTEAQFLEFLGGLEGQWGSRRKRRRIVDAANFGVALPKGWKLLLGLKRKEGNVYLHCRRYISPSGKQLTSCKEVSSYLLSCIGFREARATLAVESSADKSGNEHALGFSHQATMATRSPHYPSITPPNSVLSDAGKQTVSFAVGNPVKVESQDILRCEKCNLTFSDKDSKVKHLAFHRPSRKRRRHGKSVTDGVIIRDGKYGCQFCHKFFTERRRYNGHVGIHVKYNDRSLDTLKAETPVEKTIPSSSEGLPSAFLKHLNSVDCEVETMIMEEDLTAKSLRLVNNFYPHASERANGIASDHLVKYHKNENKAITVHDIRTAGVSGEINNHLAWTDKEMSLKSSDDDRSSVQEEWSGKCMAEANNISPEKNLQNNLKKDYGSVFNIEISGSRFVGCLANDYFMTDQVPRKPSETGKVLNGDLHLCFDSTCPLSDIGNLSTKDFARNHLPENMTSGKFEKQSNEKITCGNHPINLSSKLTVCSKSGDDDVLNSVNKIHLENNVKFSCTEESNSSKTVPTCMASDHAELVKSSSELASDLRVGNAVSDGTVVVDNIVHDKIHLSGSTKEGFPKYFTTNPGGKCGDTDTPEKESVVGMLNQSREVVKGGFMRDDTLVNGDAPRNIHVCDEENVMCSQQATLQILGKQRSVCPPVLDMISDKGDRRISCGNKTDERGLYIKGVKLESSEPEEFVDLAGLAGPENEPRPLVQQEYLQPGF